jgi:hypothetical protein
MEGAFIPERLIDGGRAGRAPKAEYGVQSICTPRNSGRGAGFQHRGLELFKQVFGQERRIDRGGEKKGVAALLFFQAAKRGQQAGRRSFRFGYVWQPSRAGNARQPAWRLRRKDGERPGLWGQPRGDDLMQRLSGEENSPLVSAPHAQGGAARENGRQIRSDRSFRNHALSLSQLAAQRMPDHFAWLALEARNKSDAASVLWMLSGKEILMRRLVSARMAAAAAIAFTIAAGPALAQEAVGLDADAAVAAFSQRDIATVVTVDGVAVTGPVIIAPKPPGDIPPSLHEQIRHLKARLDNAYPDVGDARKLHFIADYLDISFRRLWNAYHPDRPDRPPVDVRPVDVRPVDARPVDRARPVERARPIDPQRVRPTAITRIGPIAKPTPVARPVRPRG